MRTNSLIISLSSMLVGSALTIGSIAIWHGPQLLLSERLTGEGRAYVSGYTSARLSADSTCPLTDDQKHNLQTVISEEGITSKELHLSQDRLWTLEIFTRDMFEDRPLKQ